MSLDRLTVALADRYRIEREIGAGGMATVYLAEDLRHRRRVAVKVLRPELAASLGPARFTQEIEIAARLQHPHILPVHDSGEAAGFLYYVMPFVEGESLRERLAHRGEFPVHEAVRILVEVADALAYAHSHHVVHRDIKPENIMISGRHALVMDFGVAKAVSEASGRNQLTTAGVALGTPSYMAPEQATADPNLDQRVDIYALGVLGYELLSGQPPFTGGTPQQVLAAHVTLAPEPVTNKRPSVSPALASVIMRALEKRPADRWQTADEMVALLEPLATPSGGMTPTQTRPMQGVADGGRGVPRWMMGAGAAAVVALGLVGWMLVGRRDHRVVEPDRTQVTFTGNAETPALSADGQRLAYSTRRCTEAGVCTYDLVVQDVGGAGSTTVLHGWASIWSISWSTSGRFLLVTGFEGLAGRWGMFTLPSLGGGTIHFVGCCLAAPSPGDSMIVTRTAPSDTITWILRSTAEDGVARDSFAYHHVPGSTVVVWPMGAGGRLLIVDYIGGPTHLRSVERDGTPIDSMVIDDPLIRAGGTETYAGGSSILIERAQEGGNGDRMLLSFPVDADGRIARTADTVLRNVRGPWYSQPNGTLLISTGPSEYEVWVMRRESSRSMRFTQRRIASATAPLGGTVDPAGERILLSRRSTQGGKTLSQLSLVPAAGGTELPLGPAMDVADHNWTLDGKGINVAVRRGDSVDISEMDPMSGRLRAISTVAREQFGTMAAVAGGGVAIRVPNGTSILLRGVPGHRDSAYTIPIAEGLILSMASSPDGKTLQVTGWDRNADSIVVRLLSLETGKFTRLATFYADGVQAPAWLSDGMLVIPIQEALSTRIWYLIPATGGRPIRLGSPPLAADATFQMSADGKVVIARVNLTHRDIYMVRNFRELVEQ